MARSSTMDFTPRQVALIRVSFAAAVVAVLLLVFALPQSPPPPPSLAQPEHAFVDRIGLVSPAFAREWSGVLGNDPRAEIVVHIDARPPPGDVAAWTTRSASEWKIGGARQDRGVVLFIFKEPRVARVEVGYGLESVLPDARVRRLLAETIVPAFGRAQYEAGIDRFIGAVRDDLGGDSQRSRLVEAQGQRADLSLREQVKAAASRTPRLLAGTVASFREGGPGTRFAILVFVAVAAGIVLAGLGMAGSAFWRIATLPANHRAGADLHLGEIVLGIAGFGICLALAVMVLLNVESLSARTGSFGGAGAAVLWPTPPTRS